MRVAILLDWLELPLAHTFLFNDELGFNAFTLLLLVFFLLFLFFLPCDFHIFLMHCFIHRKVQHVCVFSSSLHVYSIQRSFSLRRCKKEKKQFSSQLLLRR